MKKLIFNITVPDKNDKTIIYEKYDESKKGPVYTFEDERADEILNKRTRVTNEPYAREFIEEEHQEEVLEEIIIDDAELEALEEVIIEEVKPKKAKKNK